MSMGRNPVPMELIVNNGNKSRKTKDEIEKRTEAESKIKLKSDSIIPPDWLCKQGKKMFKKFIKEFENTDILRNVDSQSIAMYCDALLDYVEATNIIKEHGMYSSDGKPHPLISKKKQFFDQCMKISSNFGLSPTDRTKLALALANDEDDKNDDSIAGKA